MIKIRPIQLICIVLITFKFSASAASSSYHELNKEVLGSINRGLEWLKTQQDKDGFFRHHPGITALAVSAFLKHPENKYKESNHTFIRNAMSGLVKLQQSNGAIYDINMQPALPNYNTSISLMALSSAGNPDYNEVIKKAQNYIKGLQIQDTESVFFGGIGYGSRATVNDLSNLNLALQALKESGFEDQNTWDNAIKFLEKCQNSSETNNQAWAGNDGGFIYAPNGESKAGKDNQGSPKSYASMTYAGLLSFIYANIDKNDQRVQSALNWIKRNFTVEENYGMGKQGLFYNYHTMAKALSIYGQDEIIDSKGMSHNWYKELADKLIAEQTQEGFWVNESSRWMEQDPVLVTAYAILALEAAYKN